MPRKVTNEDFLKKAKLVHNNDFCYLSDYINSNTKVKIKCKNSHIFWQLPHNHLKGHSLVPY